jgi:hypothetical protein
MRNPYKIFWRKFLGRCQLGRLRRRRRMVWSKACLFPQRPTGSE